jgi:hypothetical protein
MGREETKTDYRVSSKLKKTLREPTRCYCCNVSESRAAFFVHRRALVFGELQTIPERSYDRPANLSNAGLYRRYTLGNHIVFAYELDHLINIGLGARPKLRSSGAWSAPITCTDPSICLLRQQRCASNIRNKYLWPNGVSPKFRKASIKHHALSLFRTPPRQGGGCFAWADTPGRSAVTNQKG